MQNHTLRDKFNSEAIKIWKEFSSSQTRMPILLGSVQADAQLLFVGMNPSFNLSWATQTAERRELLEEAGMTANQLFAWDAQAEQKIPFIVKLEAQALDAYKPYFNPVRRFAKDVGCETKWQHLDLFLMRETSQKIALRSVLNGNHVKEGVNLFGERQLELFIELVHDIGARAVVIANATAAALAVPSLRLKKVAKEPAAYETDSLPGTRFFLSGMLSGQRAMDIFSRERLTAQVREYLLTAKEEFDRVAEQAVPTN